MSNEFYIKQARDFLRKSGTKMTITFKEESRNFFGEHDYLRNVYTVTLSRDHKTYRFEFGDSVFNTQHGVRPTQYDVLACLIKYPVPEDIWDFASEFGYDISNRDSYRRCESVHKACMTQYRKLVRLFGDELMDSLAEIN